ncbi:SDR family NAD(P)-dependent oxidoreductase [Fontimonas sp. SYSU GA230001]|uniref:SDR family NAD(P)-dependent oxidoreductase n=1 Tax=Fontimonas sp. SYSU GA230001 TaxID=3142450 RepID=UPI0032B5133F
MSHPAAPASKSGRAPCCVIVGAGPGIGQAVALAFAREGHDIALLARRPERLSGSCDEIRLKTGRQARAYAADAGDADALICGLDAAHADFGDCDALVYNVATHERGRPLQVSADQLISDFRINVVGALLAARAVAPAMVARRQGTILFTGGGFAYEPSADYASLSMDKAALRSLTYTLAQELGAHGVHVATVTVHGFVQHGTRFDPSRIAGAFVALHRQPKGHFDIETVYK